MSDTASSREPDKWMSIDEVAVFAKVSSGTVYRKIREGILPAFRQVGRTMVRPADARRLVEPVRIEPAKRRAGRVRRAGR